MSMTVTLRLSANDSEALLQFLAQVLPATRNYEGYQYVNTFVQPDNPREVILIEGSDSSELQQQYQYLRWRQESGG
jgi:quinol monooxygenase YgiN